MRIIAILAASLLAGTLFAAEEALIAPVTRNPGVVKSVSMRGGVTTIVFATRAGDVLDQSRLRKDVQSLWRSGRYEDIRVRTTEEPDGTAVVFDVVEKAPLFLRDLRLEPNTFGMQPTLPAGAPIDPLRAQQVAVQVRRKLVDRGYMDATVEPELVPVSKNKADLLLHVNAGESISVKNVTVTGDTVFDTKEVLKALQALRTHQVVPGIPGIWRGFQIHPSYSEGAIQSDLARLQSFYLARGYFDARVSLENQEWDDDNAHVKLFVQAGPHYQVNHIEIAGKGIQPQTLVPRNGLFQTSQLCGCLLRARREAETKGIVDFTARLNFHTLDNSPGHNPVAMLSAQIEEGRPYTIGRIELQGSKHYSEANVRRNLLVNESGLLDQTLLRKSIARLNQTQMFEPLEETQIGINTDEATGSANIVIPLRERKRGMWNLSGPIGPISFAGPLQFMLASRLPPWGRGVLELSTYYLSFSLIGYAHPITTFLPMAFSKHGILPVLSVFRPYTPGEGWKSGILVAPQLGWQASAYAYATSQLSSRLVPIIRGDAGFVSQLPVTFERPNGDGVLLCEPPKPRMATLRNGTAFALQFLASSPGF